MDLGERLKLCREKKGLSQKEVAEKIGIKNNTLSNYESGERRPDYETLCKLADLYEVSLDYLIKGQEHKEEKENKNLFFFDIEGLTEEEIEEIKRHIEYVKWKAKQERGKNKNG
ncbi:helix-turn-helix domain-containing protein [Parageobacillus thermoglucosidasius]|uniref:helix-turn-helix domain-containing protein n=1 Tax=Parageobacillus thermoglucosidasius TaxID=1426 RepID=UPI0001D17A7B|nr:helix-turn-helix transcriptional regulator [Parageobacillus thermoglucosidasius]AEH47105.1 helix-turn-helix domain protein [Parageobacillus thermoglucosidasius C56-YS93]